MILRIGDRIRFLNDIGGGIVTKLLPQQMVSILQDDGFEVPTPAKECVLIDKVPTQPLKEINIEPSSFMQEDNYHPDENVDLKNDSLHPLLAFVPVKNSDNQLEAYLINDSNYYSYYTLLSETKQLYTLLAHGIIESNTKLLLATINSNELENWTRLTLQLLPFKKKAFQLKSTVQQSFKLNITKFYKPNHFVKNRYFNTPALIIEVLVPDFLEKEETPKIKNTSKPHQQQETLEIDLHINKLKENCTGMSNHDILTFQLDTFHAVMREQEVNHGRQIIFIHGIGNGTLKGELKKQLQQEYAQHTVEDASFKEYGFGATRITIK